MFCPNCGKSIPEDVNFCPYCGEDIESYLRLKDSLADKEKTNVSKKERKTMQIEDIFNTKKSKENKKKKTYRMKQNIGMNFRVLRKQKKI